MSTTKRNSALYVSICALLIQAKSQMVRNVNSTMVLTYYEIGRIIVEDEQMGNYRAEYSKKVLDQVSEQLTKEFGKGYSMTNLEYIRKFYSVYSKRIPQSVIGKSGKSNKIRRLRVLAH
jgi:predicted GNAT family N-acyltransferase